MIKIQSKILSKISTGHRLQIALIIPLSLSGRLY